MSVSTEIIREETSRRERAAEKEEQQKRKNSRRERAAEGKEKQKRAVTEKTIEGEAGL